MNNRLKLILLSVTILLALAALWQVQRIAGEIRREERDKVRLWAGAVSQRAHMLEASQQFFDQATLDEHRKMQMYTDILQSFNDPDLSTDLRFSLAYVNYIVDSSHTPIIIASTRDSIISVPQELAGQKLEGDLLEEYSQNPPFHYTLWGMPMTLYYKESQYYTQLRQMLDGFTRSFLMDITQNSVKVPVLVVDSLSGKVLAYGNLNPKHITQMHFRNTPIGISLPGGGRAMVYYEDTLLLRSLRWLPLFYFFIAAVLILVSYNLLRTARTAEQNRIWVGLAKETAHQLGTPISSLSGWLEYIKMKEESPSDCDNASILSTVLPEVDKDLHRLETIAQRFSKIGSLPELQESDVCEATEAAVAYLQGRIPRRIRLVVTFPDDQTFLAPLNPTLYGWVVENLCKNAIDAMEGDGTITIVASQDARKIYIDISDTGRGMTPAVQKRIFDSGFTTKTRGWGLGLPLARRIINQYHRGRLYLKYSIPNQGSCFRIVLRKKQ